MASSVVDGISGHNKGHNERSFIATVIPRSRVGNSLPVMVKQRTLDPSALACLQGNMTAMVADYAARQKIGGVNLNFFIVRQFPILPPEITRSQRQFSGH